MLRRGVFVWLTLLFWSGMVSSAPLGNKKAILDWHVGDNPVFSDCSGLPFSNQVDACKDFMNRLNPDHPELVNRLQGADNDRLERVLHATGRDKQFDRIQLITVPADLHRLLQNADGSTVFILDARYGDYPLEDTVAPSRSFALIGGGDEWNDMKPTIKLGGDFGNTLHEMFDLEMVDISKTAIFSNLVFDPESSIKHPAKLEFIIQSSSALDYLIIDQIEFNSEGMQSSPLQGLVSIADMQGVANIVGSSMDMSNVKRYGVTIHACKAPLDDDCETTLRFNENTATGPQNSGWLQLWNVKDFHAEENYFQMSGKAGFTEDELANAVFDLIYDATDKPVSGLFNLNTVDGCTDNYPFASMISSTGEVLTELRGEIVFNNNSYGSCGAYEIPDSLPSLTLSDDLPEALKATLFDVFSTFGLPVVSSAGEPELTSSVVTLTREMVSVASSQFSATSSDSSGLDSSSPIMKPSPSASFFSSSSSDFFSTTVEPWVSSSNGYSLSTSSKVHTTSLAPNPTSTSARTSSAAQSPVSTHSITPSSVSSTAEIVPSSTFSSIASFSPFPSMSPSPFSGSGSGMKPTNKPTVLPPRTKLAGGQIGGIIGGVIGGIIGATVVTGVVAYLVRKCVKKYSNPEDITGIWNLVTLGMCYCHVRLSGESGRNYIQMEDKASESRVPLYTD